ncbi:MAG: tetratricopeptide repeat protein [Syntrophobacteraceae bacterium]|nr:tetratricopeptide repeat protein [Syntrophobacteraceae bacterium]
MNSRRGYPYGSAGPLYGARKEKEKRPLPSGHGRALVICALVLALAGGAFYFFVARGNLFPTKLIALSFLHNGQEMLLLPDSKVVVNPRDTLQLAAVKTDGWLKWGTRVVSDEVDIRPVTSPPGSVIRDLFSGESFENPKTLNFTVLLWGKQAGKVSFLIQLDYKDWIQKANATPDLDRRIEYLQKALSDNSSNILIKTQLAGLYFDIKHYKEAERLYREINQAGKSRDISEKLLLIYQAMNKPDQALDTYLDLMSMTGDQETFADFLSYLKKKKSVAQAQSFLARHERDIPASFRSQALVEIAELASSRKDWQGAAQAWRNAQRAGVKSSDVQYNLAVTLMRTGKTDAAIDAFEGYLQKNPGDAKTLALVADLCVKGGKFARAKAIYQSMVKKNPRDKQALASLVALSQKTNDKAAEIEAYENLLRLDPSNRKYQFNVSMLYMEQKKYNLALPHLKALVSLDPQNVPYRKQLLVVYQKLNNTQGAARVSLQLAELNPGDPASLDTIYRSFAVKNDYKGMQAFFRTIAAKNPNLANVHKYLLQAATKLGDKKAALLELEQLIRLQPQQKEYHRLAAYLYEQQGNYDAAGRQLQTILKIDFKDKKAQQDYERVKLEQLQHGSLKGEQKEPQAADPKAKGKPRAKAKAEAKAKPQAKAKPPAKAVGRGAAAKPHKPPKPPKKGSKSGDRNPEQTQ